MIKENYEKKYSKTVFSTLKKEKRKYLKISFQAFNNRA